MYLREIPKLSVKWIRPLFFLLFFHALHSLPLPQKLQQVFSHLSSCCGLPDSQSPSGNCTTPCQFHTCWLMTGCAEARHHHRLSGLLLCPRDNSILYLNETFSAQDEGEANVWQLLSQLYFAAVLPPTVICFTVIQLHWEWWKTVTDWKHRRKRRGEREQGRRGRRKMGNGKRERKATQITALNLITHRKWPQDSWKQLGNSSAEVTDVQIWIPVLCLMALLLIVSECSQWLECTSGCRSQKTYSKDWPLLKDEWRFLKSLPRKAAELHQEEKNRSYF